MIISYSTYSVQSLILQGLQGILKPSFNYEGKNKMTTHTAQPAQNYPQSTGNLKIILSLIAGIFLFYAVQHHFITALFCELLSQVFDSFSVKFESKSLTPEIFCMSLFALSWLGFWHLVRFYFTQLLIVLAVAIIMAVMFSDNFQLAESGSLAVVGRGE